MSKANLNSKTLNQPGLFFAKKIIQRSSHFTLVAVYPLSVEKMLENYFSFLAELRPFRLICLKTHCANKPAVSTEQTCRLRNGREEICLEKISFCSASTDFLFKPALWSGLIQHNLTAILFWVEKIELLKEFLSANQKFFDKLIIDSSIILPSPKTDWKILWAATSFLSALSDLSWSVLFPYRLALAQVFDDPAKRTFLKNLDNIIIRNFTPDFFYLLSIWLAKTLKIDLGLDPKKKYLLPKSVLSKLALAKRQTARQEICFIKNKKENLTIKFSLKKDTLIWQLSNQVGGVLPFGGKEKALLEEVDNLSFDPVYYGLLNYFTKQKNLL